MTPERLQAIEHRLATTERPGAALLEALEAINGCIAWSDTAQQWHLLGRERTQPALELVRAAIAAAKGVGE